MKKEKLSKKQERLKECPRCDYKDVQVFFNSGVSNTDKEAKKVYVMCGCHNPTKEYRTEKEAIKAWNGRK